MRHEMAKRVLLHVGLDRTDTRTIQRTLAARRPALARIGAVYPGAADTHNDLIGAAHRKGPRHGWYRRRGLSPEVAQQLAEQQLSAIRAGVATGASVIILSSSYFQSLGAEDLTRLDLQVSGLGYQLETLCFLRAPLTHTANRITQGVRQNSARVSQMLDRPYPPLAREHCEAALRALGRKRVHLRRAEDLQAGWLTANLLRVAGLSPVPGTVRDLPGPPPLCHDAVYLLDAINAADVGEGPDRPMFKHHEAELYAMKGRRFILPPDAARRVQAHSRIEQDWLFRHFGLSYPALKIRDVPTHWQEIEWAADALAEVTRAEINQAAHDARDWPPQSQAISA
jgi:hypothetical protein